MRSPLQRRAVAALSGRLAELHPRGSRPLLDRSGAVLTFEDTLLPHLTSGDADRIRAWFDQGDGDEPAPRPGLQPKAHTAHSSATLAANTFAPFHGRPQDLTIAGLSGFEALRLEARHHPLPEQLDGTGVQHRREANLDAELTGPGVVVGIESKLTEHLAARPTKPLRWEYRRTATVFPLPEPWRDAVRRRQEGSETPTFLDTAQLLKHAVGLCRSAQDGAFGTEHVDLHLIYLYWEPADGDTIEEVVQHRTEVQAFADETRGPGLTFHAVTHRELWEGWAAERALGWVASHARALAERYGIAVGS